MLKENILLINYCFHLQLMEGRKQVGGKLEIKVRVRNPILTKQIEHINEKWLVLDAEG